MLPTPLQKKILLLLVALWAVIAAAMYLWGPKESKVAAAPTGKSPTTRTAPAKARGELDLLPWERGREPLEEGAHNPFHPLAGYLEPPPPKVAKVKVVPPPPPDPFMEELKTFKYFGFAVDERKRVAFIGKGTDSYTVKEKDIIENKFLVKKITEEYVVLGEPQGPKELTISQSGFGEAGPAAGRPMLPGAGVSPQPTVPPRPVFIPPPPPSATPSTPSTPPTGRGPRDRQFPVPPRPPFTKGGTTP